ncbi:olfactory receptor class A-like protein 1 [Erpetoichthys calabaricus]|uniref:olfactory receptor class A-like protein 1 n=1 Tax=Erpetoichthys calabaricus TaxID=27687 RepID=UPI0022345819|nr:olfactory receptor class A-like protein 1 [Erpetoichthys calabaricus]
MDTRAVVKAVAFVILTVISIPSNMAICYAFLHTLLIEGKLMTADVILCHLSFANLVVTLTRGIPQTLTAFGYKNLFDDLGCKFIVLCFRTFRGLSISLTCLLSAYQAVVISPATSKMAVLKTVISQYLVPLVVFLYKFCCVTSVYPILHAVSKVVNNTIPLYTFNLEFCIIPYPDYTAFMAAGLSNFFRDLIFILGMTIMSGYILVLLYQHSKKVKNIRSSDRGQSGARAETKASRAVVTLVVLYVIFFGVDNVIWLYSLGVLRVAPIFTDFRVFFYTLYSSVCPIVVIITNPKVKGKLNSVKLNKLVSTAGSCMSKGLKAKR